MSSLRNNINFIHSTPYPYHDALHVNGYHAFPQRSRTPISHPTPVHPHLAATMGSDLGVDEDPKLSIFKDIYARNEARLGALFNEDGEVSRTVSRKVEENTPQPVEGSELDGHPQIVVPPPKKAARAIDEDDYDESDGDEEENNGPVPSVKVSSIAISAAPPLPSTPMLRRVSSSSTPASVKGGSAFGQSKSSEDVRKRLEEDKKATEIAAKRSFHTFFYSLENDRDAMLDQKKLDESERQVDVEMNGSSGSGGHANASSGNGQQGTLSQTNLGASSLTLKHLIARIDAKRDQVRASDAELRSLMSEVRKNRSKWASNEKIGQEELYEAAEKVLSELKAMTEHSTAFLTRVNKREAPDYYNGNV